MQQKSQDWFCIKPYIIYSVYFIQKFSKVKDKKKERKILTTSFSYNTKIQNPSHYFNVSGNIIK